MNISSVLSRRSRQFCYVVVIFILAACQTVSPSPTTIPPTEPYRPSETDTLEPETTVTPLTRAAPTVTQTSPPPTSTKTTMSPTPGPPQSNPVILGFVGQPNSLNPITEYNPALRELTPLLFDTLLQVDPQTAELRSGLAQNWEYSEDGQRATFHLLPDLRWSTGDRITAADIIDSLEATQHPALLSFNDLRARDNDTLELTFIKGNCAAVTALAQLPLVPATDITATIPIGSGPFVVTNWSESKRTLDLTQNPYYHGSIPSLNGLAIRFLHENEIAVALSEGKFDAMGPIQLPILNSQLPIYESQLTVPNSRLTINSSQFTNLVYPAAQVIYVAINYDPHNDAPLEPEVRQALLLALDREAILAETLNGDGQLMAASLLPGHWAANNDLSPPDYDPATARRLLAQAGLKDTDGDGWLDQYGQRLELSIRQNGKEPLHQNLGWLISGYYRDLGLFARAESVPFDSIVDDLFTHDFTLAIFSWPVLADPDQRLFWHSAENSEGIGLNFTSFNNAQVDALLDEGVAVPGCQPQSRVDIYTDLQRSLAQERPVDFLLTPNQHLLVADRLQGVQPGPFAPFTWNVTGWYLEE